MNKSGGIGALDPAYPAQTEPDCQLIEEAIDTNCSQMLGERADAWEGTPATHITLHAAFRLTHLIP